VVNEDLVSEIFVSADLLCGARAFVEVTASITPPLSGKPRKIASHFETLSTTRFNDDRHISPGLRQPRRDDEKRVSGPDR
jgi:hypothetical protein